jgi:7-carboxy-7-deazaguanine synthase
MVVNLSTPAPARANINEWFGPTIQGEGPHAGQRVGFLRFAGCNLSCSWCDTPYSWDWERFDRAEESHPMTVEDIAAEINKMSVPRLIITGGEPLLQQRIIPALHELTGCLLDIETNGTRKPTAETIAATDLFNVSPKLSFANDPEEWRLVDEAMECFAELSRSGKAVFKFVCEKVEDFIEVREILDRYGIGDEAVWIMPEGYAQERHLKHLRDLATPVVEQGWNLTTRLHVLAWETIRKA